PEDPGESLLGRPVRGEDVEGPREQDTLLVGATVVGAAGAVPAFGDGRGSGDRRHRRRAAIRAPVGPAPPVLRARGHRPPWPGRRSRVGRKYRRRTKRGDAPARGRAPDQAVRLLPRTGRPSVRRTTSTTSSAYSSALPCSAAVRTQPWTWSSRTRIDSESTA